MGNEVVGSVASLWRYPVKSMRGEELKTSDVTERGLVGNRVYALIDGETGKLASAKHPRKWARLMDFGAAFVQPPRVDCVTPPVRITFPDGSTFASTEPGLDRRFSDALGRAVIFAANAPEAATFEEVWPAIKGSRLYGRVQPAAGGELVTDVPAAFAAPAGTFFDFSTVHLLTTNTLDRLHELAPESRFEVRRFRPNIVLESPRVEGFVENAWARRVVRIGEVRLKVIIPTPRCVMTTLAQGDLPEDPRILRATAEHNRIRAGGLGELPCAGVYAAVLTAGTIRQGDPVRLE
jgi:MOSC domain-containing protein